MPFVRFLGETRPVAVLSAPATPAMSSDDPTTAPLAATLSRHVLFGRLGAATCQEWAGRFTRRTFGPGETVLAGAAWGQHLALLLSGTVELRHLVQSDARTDVHPGALLGCGSAPYEAPAQWAAVAAGPVEVALLAAADVSALCAAHVMACSFLEPPAPGGGTEEPEPHLSLMSTPVRALLRHAPVTLPPHASIGDAAQLMRERGVSSVMLLEQDHLFGLITDRDLRNRAVAAGLDLRTPVADIATVAPLTIDVTRPAFDVLLLMARHNIHHVPVLDGTRVVGMVTATDVTERYSTSAVALAGEIHKQAGLPGLVQAADRVKLLQRSLAASGASAYVTGRIVTAITDAITARLLQMAEADLGPAPVPYAWVAAGSQARSEQTARSDQDNCLVLDDTYEPATHGPYFEALARQVNDGLNACGYVYCPGDMMARTDAWRQPRRVWSEYFRRWTAEPEPKALMLTCVFFDQRVVHGDAPLLDGLRQEVLRETRGNRIFLAYMVGNALTHRPPLTLFGGIATTRAGEVRDAVDLKHSGIVPIVDLARIYALAGGHEAVNTYERLDVAAHSGEISERSARDLRDALEFMARLRIRHQARQLSMGLPADNLLSLGTLSNFERGQLKDAFGVVQTLQAVLAQRYR